MGFESMSTYFGALGVQESSSRTQNPADPSSRENVDGIKGFVVSEMLTEKKKKEKKNSVNFKRMTKRQLPFPQVTEIS